MIVFMMNRVLVILQKRLFSEKMVKKNLPSQGPTSHSSSSVGLPSQPQFASSVPGGQLQSRDRSRVEGPQGGPSSEGTPSMTPPSKIHYLFFLNTEIKNLNAMKNERSNYRLLVKNSPLHSLQSLQQSHIQDDPSHISCSKESSSHPGPSGDFESQVQSRDLSRM